jgi:hypothetical protein
LGPTNLTKLETYLAGLGSGLPHNLEEYCALIQSQIAIGISPQGLAVNINIVLTNLGISLTSTELAALVACLFEVFGRGTDNNTGGLTTSYINTDTASVFNTYKYSLF